MDNLFIPVKGQVTVGDYDRKVAALSRKPIKAYPHPVTQPIKELVSTEVLAEVDKLVYEAYLAGINQKDATNPETKGLGFNTTHGELTVKAALWCQHVGTR